MKEFFEQPLSPDDPNGEIISELENFGARVVKQRNLTESYVASFDFGEALVTIGFVLHDEQTGADLVINTITTLPEEENGKGWGSRGVGNIIRWAVANNLIKIKAVQVQDHNIDFWVKNGFEADLGEEAERIGLYSYRLKK